MMIQTHLYEWCKSQPSIFFIYHRYTIFLQCHIFCKLRFSIQMYCMNFEAVLRYASWNYLWRHQFCSFEKDNFIFFYFLIGTIIEMHSCTFTFVFCLAPFFFLKVSLSVSLSFVKFLFFCLFFSFCVCCLRHLVFAGSLACVVQKCELLCKADVDSSFKVKLELLCQLRMPWEQPF